MNLINFFIIALIISSVASWILTLGYKWNIIEWVQVNAKTKLVHQMFMCKFCLSWWTCVVLSIIAAIITMNGWVLLIPFVGTKLTQWLITR